MIEIKDNQSEPQGKSKTFSDASLNDDLFTYPKNERRQTTSIAIKPSIVKLYKKFYPKNIISREFEQYLDKENSKELLRRESEGICISCAKKLGYEVLGGACWNCFDRLMIRKGYTREERESTQNKLSPLMIDERSKKIKQDINQIKKERTANMLNE